MRKCEHKYEAKVISKVIYKRGKDALSNDFYDEERVESVLLYCEKCGDTKAIDLKSGKQKA